MNAISYSGCIAVVEVLSADVSVLTAVA